MVGTKRFLITCVRLGGGRLASPSSSGRSPNQPPLRNSSLADGHLYRSRPIRLAKALHWVAVEVVAHGVVGRIIDDETRGRPEEGRNRRPLHNLMRLRREGHRRLREVERDFEPTFRAAGNAVDADLRWARLGAEQIGAWRERRPPRGFALGGCFALLLIDLFSRVAERLLDLPLIHVERGW